MENIVDLKIYLMKKEDKNRNKIVEIEEEVIILVTIEIIII